MLMDNQGQDPAQLIYRKIGMKKAGIIPGFELFGNRLLLGVYERPEKTAKGIMLPETYRAEEEHQGKAALVLMKGPSSFVDDANFSFQGQNLEIGDWVMIFVSHGIKCVVNGQLCRIIRDQDITMKIPAPDTVF